jgi:nucleotide-binding universal stress UspA family protein
MTLDRVMVSITPSDREDLDAIVEATINVVESTDATVYLLYLFPEGDYESLLEEMDIEPTSGALSPDELAARHDSVRTPASTLEANDIDYEIRGVAGGEAAGQVVKRADELDADVVVVAGSKRSPAGKAMFGDHAQQVLLNASTPVLYVKRE